MTPSSIGEFSFRTRAAALKRFREETFDLLIIGGGITGAGVAWDAASRGLKVALVERGDFASGTSSRSSKLIHGGLRYLENLELGLVFEALSERAHLLKTAPHMVRPLKFYLPVYRGAPNGRFKLSLGLWLYDLLALFRAPGFHKLLSRKRLLREIPFLKSEGLRGGFHYYDASMWDDAMTVEVLRAANALGASIANYVEAVSPIWTGDRITGFRVRDREGDGFEPELNLRAKRVVVCAGPWTDAVGAQLSPKWRSWLSPSKGVHLIFDLKRIPIPGALVMSHPEDGRIAFVIPRPDFGAGVVIVGTTDGPTPTDPARAEVEAEEVRYLMDLLNLYFPELRLTDADIVSAYVGVRPLVNHVEGRWKGSELELPRRAGGGDGNAVSSGGESLQKISREHHIDMGPGGTVVVAGGKYTTFRRMAEEIVDFTLKAWREDAQAGHAAPVPEVRASATAGAMNPDATFEKMAEARRRAQAEGVELPESLLERYGADALAIAATRSDGDPEGFPCLEEQLRHSICHEMTMHLDDFFIRRTKLYSARADHGEPWMERLAAVWARALGRDSEKTGAEIARLREEIARRTAWKSR